MYEWFGATCNVCGKSADYQIALYVENLKTGEPAEEDGRNVFSVCEQHKHYFHKIDGTPIRTYFEETQELMR